MKKKPPFRRGLSMLRHFIIPMLVIAGVLMTAEPGLPVFDDETLKQKVQPYIEAGVDFLKRTQTGSGTWSYLGNSNPNNEQAVGCAALCGIALMENRVPTTDRTVQNVAKVVRAAATQGNFNYNYSVCLCMLFLDRFHKDRVVRKDGQVLQHADSALILSLANKLVLGQAQDGRWGYTLTGSAGDNSNTQFAVVALWIARKYSTSKKIEQSLLACEKRLRGSQEPGGGWNYEPSNVQVTMKPTGSMTCAGILAIALNTGMRIQNRAEFSGQAGNAAFQRMTEEDGAIIKARNFLVNALDVNCVQQNSAIDSHLTYFLWSLERVATLLKWRKLNGVDWFEIGAQYLMARQQRDGSWRMDFLSGEFVDTGFALLFLGKSNLLGDLYSTDFTGGTLGNSPPPAKKAPAKQEDTKVLAKELLSKLLTANADKQADLLTELQEGKGGDYTDALVSAIKGLQTNVSKENAREALANRFARLKVQNLVSYMTDSEREIRLAAVTAVKSKRTPENAMTVYQNVIPLLSDMDIGVSNAAHETMKSLTNQDFGKSVDRWSRWLEQTKTGKP